MGGEDGYYRKPAVDRGIDASFLLTPHYGHPLFGSLVAGSYADGAYLAAGFVCYLGFLPLALAAWAIWRRRPGALFWALYALAGVILSLGERPLWRGELLEELTLPFAAIKYLPLLDLLRVANRFLLPASLGLAAAAAYGWLALPRRTNAIFALLACGIFFEYLWAPFPVREVDLPAAYDALAEAPPGAVIDVPFFQRSRTAIDMVGQTRHGRPIVAGYLSTDAPETVAMLREEPALADLVDIPKLERPIDFERLRELGFVAFVVHKDRAESYRRRLLETVDPTNMPARKNASRFGGIPDETIGEILRQLNEESGAPIFEDERTAIFLLSPGA